MHGFVVLRVLLLRIAAIRRGTSLRAARSVNALNPAVMVRARQSRDRIGQTQTYRPAARVPGLAAYSTLPARPGRPAAKPARPVH